MKIGIGFVTAIVLASAYWGLSDTGAMAIFTDGAILRGKIDELGMFGPLAVIGLMMIAVVMSPIPSAPIALAAGAAFGHVWGTIYVLLGAEIGALIAFGIARLLGYEVLKKWFGEERLSLGLLGSQNMLTWLVFVTRLLPFISFDLVSYAAGLTSITVLRFTIATLAGIIPASFLLAHFGGEMVSANPERIMIAVIAAGALTLVPLIYLYIKSRRKEGGFP